MDACEEIFMAGEKRDFEKGEVTVSYDSRQGFLLNGVTADGQEINDENISVVFVGIERGLKRAGFNADQITEIIAEIDKPPENYLESHTLKGFDPKSVSQPEVTVAPPKEEPKAAPEALDALPAGEYSFQKTPNGYDVIGQDGAVAASIGIFSFKSDLEDLGFTNEQFMQLRSGILKGELPTLTVQEQHSNRAWDRDGVGKNYAYNEKDGTGNGADVFNDVTMAAHTERDGSDAPNNITPPDLKNSLDNTPEVNL